MSWSGFNLHFSQAYWCWTYLLSYGELWWSVCLPVFKLGLSTTSAMGACHLPPQGLNQMLLQLCVFNTPDRSSGWRAEMCWGRNWQNRSSDRYFQEPILWAQFLYLLVSRKALKILNGDNCSSWLRATLFKKIRAWLHALSLPPNHLYSDLSPLPLWSSFSELSEMLSPRLRPSFYPQ